MSATHVEELPADARARVLAKIRKQDVPNSAPSTEIVPLSDIVLAVKHRELLDDDELGSYIEGAFIKLATVVPLIEEMRRRFQNLDRKKQVDGSYKTIRGCRNFQDYCRDVLHRTEQTVYELLKPRKPKLEKIETEPKEIPEHLESKPPKDVTEILSIDQHIQRARELTTLFVDAEVSRSQTPKRFNLTVRDLTESQIKTIGEMLCDN
jgi:hypothetical protein